MIALLVLVVELIQWSGSKWHIDFLTLPYKLHTDPICYLTRSGCGFPTTINSAAIPTHILLFGVSIHTSPHCSICCLLWHHILSLDGKVSIGWADNNFTALFQYHSTISQAHHHSTISQADYFTSTSSQHYFTSRLFHKHIIIALFHTHVPTICEISVSYFDNLLLLQTYENSKDTVYCAANI